ncbi:hypothetical protein [Actinomadura sp. 3N508]|uniref:hypothetical protein n=1 Tax=Actinomadura sp. 3N508 TaxID=3375153 RepID=UPI0037B9C98C
MHNDEAIIAEMQRMALQGDSPTRIAAWLVGQVDITKFFHFIRYFFEAFIIPVEVLRETEAWVGFGRGGPLSDAEFDQLLSPLKVRHAPPHH